jgi:hypothetical protein
MQTKHIIYLDFDGVLHPDSVFLENGKPALKHCDETDGDETLFCWAYILEHHLKPYPDVRIILSTSWVPALGFDKAKKVLPTSLQDRVIGATWHNKYAESLGLTRHNWMYLSRYSQIATHRSRNLNARWIAIDNDDDNWDQRYRDNLVHTDDWRGLAPTETQEDLAKKLAELCHGK